MPKLILLFAITFLTGCAYHSVVITSKAKKNSTINYSEYWDSLVAFNSNSILTNTESLTKLLKKNKEENGSFYLFMSNSQIFIEANGFNTREDSINLRGTIYNKAKNDTLSIIITFSKKSFDLKSTTLKNSSYSITIKNPNKDFNNNDFSSDSTFAFTISNSKNFIIDREIMELMTGEISTNISDPFKFVIVNDISDTKVPIGSLWMFSFISTKSEKDHYINICKKKLGNQCPKGYELEFTFNWKNWLYKDINCICK